MKHVRVRIRLLQRWISRFILHSVLHADDPPHRLALGIAIGVFITFTPTVGFQMALVVFLAWLLRANKIVGLPIVWLTNPVTIVPIYYTCYRVGRFVLQQPPVGFGWWSELSRPPKGWLPAAAFYSRRFTEIAWPLWMGSLLVGLLLGYLAYYASYHAICAYRMKRWGQLIPPCPPALPIRRRLG
jgi:hypothetical protein